MAPFTLIERKIKKRKKVLITITITLERKISRKDNENLIFYIKASGDLSNITLKIVNMDPFHKQSGYVKLPLEEFGITPGQTYLVTDLISNNKYIWQGESNYVELNPDLLPAHIFRLHRRLHHEVDFYYYM